MVSLSRWLARLSFFSEVFADSDKVRAPRSWAGWMAGWMDGTMRSWLDSWPREAPWHGPFLRKALGLGEVREYEVPILFLRFPVFISGFLLKFFQHYRLSLENSAKGHLFWAIPLSSNGCKLGCLEVRLYGGRRRKELEGSTLEAAARSNPAFEKIHAAAAVSSSGPDLLSGCATLSPPSLRDSLFFILATLSFLSFSFVSFRFVSFRVVSALVTPTVC